MNLRAHSSSNRPPLGALCSLLGYSRQAFYQHLKAQQVRTLQHDLVVQRVLHIRQRQPRVGTRKLHIMLQPFLQEHHISMGRDALFALLADQGLLVKGHNRTAPRTTFSDHWMHKYADLTVGLQPLKAHELWVGDITYIVVAQGFCYLSLVSDVYSHMIVGYHLDTTLEAQGCVQALQMALGYLPAEHALIHHSDRGSQYCSWEYVEVLQGRGIAISMTQSSDPRDNAIAERVNGILKQELLEQRYQDERQASEGVSQAIAVYNTERLHSSVDMLTPSEAVLRTGELKRWWKSYYKTKQTKQVSMPAG